MNDAQIGFSVAGARLIRCRAAQTFVVLALSALAAGCGPGDSPLASADGPRLAPAAKKGGQGGQRKSEASTYQQDSDVSAGLGADEARSISKWVKPNGNTSIYLRPEGVPEKPCARSRTRLRSCG